MSNSDDPAARFKGMRAQVLLQNGDEDLGITQAPEPPRWSLEPDALAATYLVSYAAQGTRWWERMSPRPGYGLGDVLNSPLLQGADVSHVRVTRLARAPDHMEE